VSEDFWKTISRYSTVGSGIGGNMIVYCPSCNAEVETEEAASLGGYVECEACGLSFDPGVEYHFDVDSDTSEPLGDPESWIDES
jgi:hypothetical protein